MKENKINRQDIRSLLSQVHSIKQKYNQIAELTGERFNVFSILNLQDSETRLHSKLINELLNPKGRHGQKDLFLKHFIDVVNSKITDDKYDLETGNISIQKIKSFNSPNATAEIEKHAGFKSENSTEGGRIDILINDNNGHGIIIENKIWAGDQEKQLLRYNNYGNKNFKSFHLIYLTLDGKMPSSLSTGESLKYLCLSYNDDIIYWLELCRKECIQLPIIRETITQYINQLKNYSGQSINHMESYEIVELLVREGNFITAVDISNNIDKARRKIEKIFFEKLKDKIDRKFEWHTTIETESDKKKATEYFLQIKIKNEIHYRIMIENNQIRFGFKAFGEKRDDDPCYHFILDELNNKFNNNSNYKNEQYWIAFNTISEQYWTNKDKVLADFCDITICEKLLNNLKDITESIVPPIMTITLDNK